MSNTAEQDPHAGEERTTRKPDNAQFVVCAAVFAIAIRNMLHMFGNG